jgi:hypothetical protein
MKRPDPEWRELLTPAEVRDLTGCVPRDNQARKLTALGVPFRRDGSRILVNRFHLREWLAGKEFSVRSGGVRLDLVR